MFGTLFLKECKQILKSMVYYIYVAVFVIFLSTQLGASSTSGPVSSASFIGGSSEIIFILALLPFVKIPVTRNFSRMEGSSMADTFAI